MSDFVFLADEISLLSTILSTHGSNIDKYWSDDLTKPLRDRLKKFLMLQANNSCAYCRSDLSAAHKMTIDIEHIMPKDIYKYYTFSLTNLSISCRRCNFPPFKHNKVDFIVNYTNPINYQINDFESNNYLFIHPNLDNYYDHILFELRIVNGDKYRRYSVQNNSAKGLYTMNYFKLKDLEILSYDEKQNIPTNSNSIYAPLIPQNI